MKFLFDLIPIILFFVAYKIYDIFVAIGVSIVASLLQIIVYFIRTKKYEKTQVVTFVMLVLFGGLTIILRDPKFLMWKVSLVNILFAIVFVGSYFIGEKTLVERMLGKQITLPKKVWNNLNWGWSGLFLLIALINVYFVQIAIASREKFAKFYQNLKEESLNQIDCAKNISPDLCLLAQNAEENWVNFKLFGTMGLTIIFLILTGILIKKYIKEV